MPFRQLAIIHATECYPPVLNGVATSVYTQVHQLKKSGHKPYVITPKPHGKLAKQDITPLYLPSISLPGIPYPITAPLYSKKVRLQLRDLPAQVIHVHHPFFISRIAVREAKRRHIPLVFHCHTNYEFYPTEYLPQFLQKAGRRAVVRWIRRFANRCTWIIAPSETVKQQLLSYRVRRPITVIPTAAEPLATTPSTHSPNDTPTILFVGRLAPEKNIPLLLSAFQEIVKKLPKSQLIIIGEGPELTHLTKLAGQNVIFTGGLSHTETLEMYSKATVFALPAPHETQGLCTAEALAAGIPCVVVDKGGAKESITEGITGFITKPNIKDFSTALLKILEDADLGKEMSRAARSWSHVHTPEVMMHAIEEVYYQALEEPSHLAKRRKKS